MNISINVKGHACAGRIKFPKIDVLTLDKHNIKSGNYKYINVSTGDTPISLVIDDLYTYIYLQTLNHFILIDTKRKIANRLVICIEFRTHVYL